MKSSPRGMAIIVNNHDFGSTGLDPRPSSMEDVKRLQHLWQQLDFSVMVQENLSASVSMAKFTILLYLIFHC